MKFLKKIKEVNVLKLGKKDKLIVTIDSDDYRIIHKVLKDFETLLYDDKKKVICIPPSIKLEVLKGGKEREN